MPGTDAEIVIQTERKQQEVDIKVHSADQAAQRFTEAGGTVVVPPFDIQIGRWQRSCAIRGAIPWCSWIASKGLLATDSEGNVTGNLKSQEAGES